MTLTDWIGFSGVFLILLGYFLNVFGILATNNRSFIMLNLIGATLACYASYRLQFIPFVILEGVWALVSLIALFKTLKTRTT
jgi:hypothetical protein